MIDQQRNQRFWQACGFIPKQGEEGEYWWHQQLNIFQLNDLDGGLPDPDYSNFPYYLLQLALSAVLNKLGGATLHINRCGKQWYAGFTNRKDMEFKADALSEAMFNALEKALGLEGK